MKRADRRRIARAIRAQVPELYEKGVVLAATPRGRILRGVLLETSAWDPQGVYLWVFVQPLFVPSSTIVLSLGDRLGGGCKTWSVDEADAAAILVRDEGVPFFGPISTPEALASWSYLDGATDSYSREARASALVASGQFSRGARLLRELAGSLSDEDDRPWVIETRKRAERLADLAETDPAGAQDLLLEWEAETVAALRVQAIP